MISRSSFGPRFLGLLVAFSDNYSKYRIVGRMFEGGHEVVQHENREYVRIRSDVINADVGHRLQCWVTGVSAVWDLQATLWGRHEMESAHH